MKGVLQMKKQRFRAEQDGFHGAWYPLETECDTGMIIMLGDSSEDRMAVCGAGWVNQLGCHVMAMSPEEKDYGHHNYPLERFGKAIAFMKEQGCRKIGITGASTTGMLALLAASYYPDITLTIAVSPSDFVMEGFYQDGKDGMRERPGDQESTVTWQGKPLPYLPFAWRHPEYWQRIKAYSKATGNAIASREMFEISEQLHPIQEEEKIKVERIKGKLILIGAEDDALWDTCRYIRRIQKRLEELPHDCTCEAWLYEHGTHFAFPESLLKKILPVGSGFLVKAMFKAGRDYPKECRETRIDIDRRMKQAILEWRNGNDS